MEADLTDGGLAGLVSVIVRIERGETVDEGSTIGYETLSLGVQLNLWPVYDCTTATQLA